MGKLKLGHIYNYSYPHHSSGQIAEHLKVAFAERFEVVTLEEADLIYTTIWKYIEAKKANSSCPIVFEINNCHPDFRLEALEKESRRVGVPISNSKGEVWIGDVKEWIRESYAVCGAGNEFTASTYLDRGISRVKFFSYSWHSFGQVRGSGDSTVISSAADWCLRKGWWKIKEIAAALPDVTFRVIGNLIPNETYPSNIHTLGYIDNLEERYKEAYLTADAYLLPTLEEGLPGTTLEAIFCGLPVYTTIPGGVNHPNACVLPVDDLDGMIEAIKERKARPITDWPSWDDFTVSVCDWLERLL